MVFISSALRDPQNWGRQKLLTSLHWVWGRKRCQQYLGYRRYLWRWWSSWIHIMSPPSAFFQRCSATTIRDLDADIIFAFCHQNFDWWRIDRAMKFDCCAHWIFEKLETDVMKMRWNISHLNIFSVFILWKLEFRVKIILKIIYFTILFYSLWVLKEQLPLIISKSTSGEPR